MIVVAIYCPCVGIHTYESILSRESGIDGADGIPHVMMVGIPGDSD